MVRSSGKAVDISHHMDWSGARKGGRRLRWSWCRILAVRRAKKRWILEMLQRVCLEMKKGGMGGGVSDNPSIASMDSRDVVYKDGDKGERRLIRRKQ